MRGSTPERSSTPTRRGYVDATKLGYDVRETRTFQRNQSDQSTTRPSSNGGPSRAPIIKRHDSFSNSSNGLHTPRVSSPSLHTHRSGDVFLKLYESGLEKKRREVETASENSFHELDKVWDHFRGSRPLPGQRPWNNSIAATSHHTPKTTEETLCPWRARQRQLEEEGQRRGRTPTRSATPPPSRLTESFKQKMRPDPRQQQEQRPPSPRRSNTPLSQRMQMLSEPRQRVDLHAAASNGRPEQQPRARPVLDRKQRPNPPAHHPKPADTSTQLDPEPQPIVENAVTLEGPSERNKSVSFREERAVTIESQCTTPEHIDLHEQSLSDRGDGSPVHAVVESPSPAHGKPNLKDLAIDSSSSSSSESLDKQPPSTAAPTVESNKPKTTQLSSILESLKVDNE